MAVNFTTAGLSDVTFPTKQHDVTTQLLKTTVATQQIFKYYVSAQTLARIDLALNCILTYIVGAFGIVGNVLNIIILSHHGFKESTNIMLVSLSISDLLFVVIQCFSRVMYVARLYDYYIYDTVLSMYFVYFVFMHQIALNMSILQVTVISLERFVAVWFPFKVSHIFTARNVIIIILILFFINFALYFPCNFYYTYRWAYARNKTFLYADFQYTEFFLSRVEVFNSYAVYSSLLMNIPLAILVICTVLIILKLVKARENLKKMTSAAPDSMKSRDKKAVRMLLTICIVAIGFFVPTSGIDIYMWLTTEGLQQTRYFRDVLVAVEGLAYQMCSSINFVIYVTMSSKFAKTYRELFCISQSSTKKLK